MVRGSGAAVVRGSGAVVVRGSGATVVLGSTAGVGGGGGAAFESRMFCACQTSNFCCSLLAACFGESPSAITPKPPPSSMAGMTVSKNLSIVMAAVCRSNKLEAIQSSTTSVVHS